MTSVMTATSVVACKVPMDRQLQGRKSTHFKIRFAKLANLILRNC